MDWAIQKACELGVTTITPMAFSRSVVKFDSETAQKKQNRWQSLAKEAAQQAKLFQVPQISQPASLMQWGGGEAPEGIKIFCNEHEREISLKNVEPELINACTINIITGPEGGFTQMESDDLKQRGWHSVSLGRTTVRAETAPLVALAQIGLITRQ
jgi:16S rRNA (uracil1498-N3)-methyltransferase